VRRSSAPALLLGLALLLPQLSNASTPERSGAVAASGAPARAALSADPYNVDPEPMTVAECGRCHAFHFRNLKSEGGGHRFDCRDCHERFHAYNPRRANYAELMPRCATCHGDYHGGKQLDCLSCHEDPHAPKRPIAMTKLTPLCAGCHTAPAQGLQGSPSAHTKQSCDACHSERHGRVPSCAECHQPHFTGQAQAGCTSCHPAHTPLASAFRPDTDPKTCAACHDGAFAAWSRTRSKHGKVNCAACHQQHRAVPDCAACHPSSHNPAFLARFPKCLDCHLDVHDLPTK
jgi:predicted CXXCH cytochrome family protein